MNKLITGIHHITAMTDDPQKNIDFYAGVLGLRLVKKTVNFDAPDVYHFYYGNETGGPGTILTFFPYQGIQKGRKGKGQLTVTSFSVAENSLDYWMKRLDKFNVPYQLPQQRFDTEEFIYLEDYNGLGLELVANKIDDRPAYSNGNIPLEYAVKGFYGATLSEDGYEKTGGLLSTYLDHSLIAEKGNRFRFVTSNNAGNFIDVVCNPNDLRALGGGGTVHHIAFSTPNDETQIEARTKIAKAGLNITEVLDREYFHSVYFREPGGVLFEIATENPGFMIDEDVTHLGESLKLPAWFEKNRNEIEAGLQPVQVNIEKFRD